MKFSFYNKYLITSLFCFQFGYSYGQSEDNSFHPNRIPDSLNYIPSRPKIWELSNTTLDIKFLFKERQAVGNAMLHLKPYFYESNEITLDAVNFDIQSIINQQTGEKLQYKYDNAVIKITLDRKYNKNESVILAINYIANPYKSKGGDKAIRSDKGLYFVNTRNEEIYQPIQFWTQGETQAASKWFPTFDSPNFRSSFTITMEVPDSFQTISNGNLIKSETLNNGFKKDTWVHSQPIPPYLVMMAGSNFHYEKETWNNKEVGYYVPQAFKNTAKSIFNHTPEMLTFFSNITKVPYPWDKYSQVVGYDFVSGAMENNTASLFGAFNLKDEKELADDHNDAIVAHELFHHWFGNYVTCETWGDLTLNESFADYGEYLWMEYKYGKNTAQKSYQNAMNRYLAQAAKNDPSLVRSSNYKPGDMFDRVSYNKGGRILHLLRNTIGDAAFFEGLRIYLNENKGSSAEPEQLRLAFEKASGLDLKWFFNQWYYKAGHPKLEINYSVDTLNQKLIVNTSQCQDSKIGYYDLNLRGGLIVNGKLEKVDWIIKSERTQTDTFDFVNGKCPVFIPDVDHIIPGTIYDNKHCELFYDQLKYTDDYLSKNYVIQLIDKQIKNANKIDNIQLKTIKLALNDNINYVVADACNVINFKIEGFDKSIYTKLNNLAFTHKDNNVRANAYKAMSSNTKLKNKAIYLKGIQDPSYKVQAAALEGLKKIDFTEAYNQAIRLSKDKIGGNLLSSVNAIISENANPKDFDYLKYAILTNYEKKRTDLLNSFTAFIINCNNDEMVKESVLLLKQIKTSNPDNYSNMVNESVEKINKHIDKMIIESKSSYDKSLWQRKSNEMQILK